jgi:cell division protein YceG involved in septum cleavage
MNKTVTFGHILTILAIIIIPLFIWGINVEVKLEQVNDNSEDIIELKKDSKLTNIIMQKNHIEVMKQLHNIELQVKDKKDR